MIWRKIIPFFVVIIFVFVKPIYYIYGKRCEKCKNIEIILHLLLTLFAKSCSTWVSVL